MPNHVNGYPIDSVNSANMLQALLTLKPVPIAPRMKMTNGTITPPMFQLTESEAMGTRRL